jgi:hypothetical protein
MQYYSKFNDENNSFYCSLCNNYTNNTIIEMHYELSSYKCSECNDHISSHDHLFRKLNIKRHHTKTSLESKTMPTKTKTKTMPIKTMILYSSSILPIVKKTNIKKCIYKIDTKIVGKINKEIDNVKTDIDINYELLVPKK